LIETRLNSNSETEQETMLSSPADAEMTDTRPPITFFAKHGNVTKRFQMPPPETIEDLRVAVRGKFATLSNFVMQTKDAEFDIVCELEDVSQVLHGVMITIEKAAEPSSNLSKAEQEINTQDLLEKVKTLEKENMDLKMQLHNKEPETIPIPEGQHVKLRGVPFDTKESDITRFLDGIEIVENGIYILKQPMSDCAKGEVLVTVPTAEDVEKAKQKHKEKINTRWIDVREAGPEDFTRFKLILEGAKYLATPSFNQQYVAKLKGLDYKSTSADVEEFVKPVVPIRVWLIFNRRAQTTGTAYVEVSSRDQLRQVMAKKKEYLGERWIDVWEAGPGELNLDLAQMVGNELKPEQLSGKGGMTTIRMEGIPRECSEQEIGYFFRAVGVSPTKIHYEKGSDHSYCEFLTTLDSNIGLTRNNAYLGSRYITMRHVHDSEIPRARAPYQEERRYDERYRRRSPSPPPRRGYERREVREPYSTSTYGRSYAPAAHADRYAPYSSHAQPPAHAAPQKRPRKAATPNPIVKMV